MRDRHFSRSFFPTFYIELRLAWSSKNILIKKYIIQYKYKYIIKYYMILLQIGGWNLGANTLKWNHRITFTATASKYFSPPISLLSTTIPRDSSDRMSYPLISIPIIVAMIHIPRILSSRSHSVLFL